MLAGRQVLFVSVKLRLVRLLQIPPADVKISGALLVPVCSVLSRPTALTRPTATLLIGLITSAAMVIRVVTRKMIPVLCMVVSRCMVLWTLVWIGLTWLLRCFRSYDRPCLMLGWSTVLQMTIWRLLEVSWLVRPELTKFVLFAISIGCGLVVGEACFAM